MNPVTNDKPKFDFCLISLWNQHVSINPLYHFTRTAIDLITAPLINQKLNEISKEIIVSTDEKTMLRYQVKYPCAPALLSLAAVLEKKYSVRIVSLDIERERIGSEEWLQTAIEEIATTTQYGVLISFVSTETTQLMKVVELFRQKKSELKVIVGGVHATYNDIELISCNNIDFVARGEGEETIVELCDSIVNRSSLINIRGITYKDAGKIQRNMDRPFMDLEQLPIPAYHLVEEFIDRIVVTTMFSRGCPYACDYCAESAFWTSRVRYKSVKHFVDELELLCNVYNQRFIHIADSTFGVNRAKLIELCNELEKREIHAFFSINIRPNVLEYMGEELLIRLRKLNFVEMYMGVESADINVVNSMNRKICANIYTTLEKLKEIGIPFVKLYLMVGSPLDNRRSFEKTLCLVEDLLEKKLIFYATCKNFVPSIGSELYKHVSDGVKAFENSVRLDRYNSPPLFVPAGTIAQEMDLYLQLILVVQYKYYLKKSDSTTRRLLKTKWEEFVSKHYAQGRYY